MREEIKAKTDRNFQMHRKACDETNGRLKKTNGRGRCSDGVYAAESTTLRGLKWNGRPPGIGWASKIENTNTQRERKTTTTKD